tara:strand:+ start:992 stop:1243 length:252 start_codon:yes stop_codon:yes gene_type:complete
MQTLTTKYLPATCNKNPRIIVKTSSGIYKFVDYNLRKSTKKNHAEAAQWMMKQLNWEGNMIGTSLETGYLFIFEGFDNIKISN